jgi:hypothetical protein
LANAEYGQNNQPYTPPGNWQNLLLPGWRVCDQPARQRPVLSPGAFLYQVFCLRSTTDGKGYFFNRKLMQIPDRNLDLILIG